MTLCRFRSQTFLLSLALSIVVLGDDNPSILIGGGGGIRLGVATFVDFHALRTFRARFVCLHFEFVFEFHLALATTKRENMKTMQWLCMSIISNDSDTGYVAKHNFDFAADLCSSKYREGEKHESRKNFAVTFK